MVLSEILQKIPVEQPGPSRAEKIAMGIRTLREL